MGEQPGSLTLRLLRHREFLEAVARGILKDDDLAQDAVQDAMLAALARSPGPIRSPRRWITAVVRNLARNILRSRSRLSRRHREAARETTVPSAVNVAARVETERGLVEAVASLDEDARTVLVLRFYDGLGPSEIARRLEIPVRTVESRIRRALDRLRSRLVREYGGDPGTLAIALHPFLRSAPAECVGASTAGALSGARLMTAKAKILIVVAVLIAFLTGYLVRPAHLPVESPPQEADPARTPAASDPAPDLDEDAQAELARLRERIQELERPGEPGSASRRTPLPALPANRGGSVGITAGTGGAGGAFRSGDSRPEVPGTEANGLPRFKSVTVRKLGNETPAFLAVARECDEVLTRENEIGVFLERRMVEKETAEEALEVFRAHIECTLFSSLRPGQREQLASFVTTYHQRMRVALRETLTCLGLKTSPWERPDKRAWREDPTLLATAVDQRRRLDTRLADVKRDREIFIERLLDPDQWKQYRDYQETNRTAVAVTL